MHDLALTLCLALPAFQEEPHAFELPRPTGPFAIGTVALEWTDAARPDPVHAEERRVIALQLWYPAQDGAEGPRVGFASPELIAACQAEGLYDQPADVFAAWADVTTQATEGATVVETALPLPVVLVSHGLGIPRALSTSLCQELASHGMVAVAIDHPYGGLVVLQDGRVLSSSSDPELGSMEGFALRAGEWAVDMGFVIDRLAKLAEGLGPAGRMDLGRVAATGHSMGGAAAVLAACGDDRIVTAVDMDGMPMGMEEKGLCKPTLLLRSDPGYTDEELEARGRSPEQWREMGEAIQAQWQGIHDRGSASLVSASVGGTSHLSYCDATYVMPDVITLFGGTFLAPERTYEVTTKILRDYLGLALRGEPSAIQVDPGRWPEVELEVWPAPGG